MEKFPREVPKEQSAHAKTQLQKQAQAVALVAEAKGSL